MKNGTQAIDDALDALRETTNTTDRILRERAVLRAIKQGLNKLADQVGQLGKAVGS